MPYQRNRGRVADIWGERVPFCGNQAGGKGLDGGGALNGKSDGRDAVTGTETVQDRKQGVYRYSKADGEAICNNLVNSCKNYGPSFQTIGVVQRP